VRLNDEDGFVRLRARRHRCSSRSTSSFGTAMTRFVRFVSRSIGVLPGTVTFMGMFSVHRSLRDLARCISCHFCCSRARWSFGALAVLGVGCLRLDGIRMPGLPIAPYLSATS
jgi:hypothetical protein